MGVVGWTLRSEHACIDAQCASYSQTLINNKHRNTKFMRKGLSIEND